MEVTDKIRLIVENHHRLKLLNFATASDSDEVSSLCAEAQVCLAFPTKPNPYLAAGGSIERIAIARAVLRHGEIFMSKALLYDSTLCIGCKQCEQACADENKLPYNDTIAAEERQSDHKYTAVLTRSDKFMRRLCMNCEDPACVSACPVAALRKTAAGPVIYEADRCMGCRYCMLACPFGVPKYEWSKALPKVRKCTMCPDRVSKGKQTACAEICPTGATKFGERADLAAEAQQRLRDNPGKYVNHIYGLNEVGGTSVLLLSSIPFEAFGYRTDVVTEAMPLLTYRVLTHVPDLVTLGSVLLGGIWWITQRRTEVDAAEGPKRETSTPEKNK